MPAVLIVGASRGIGLEFVRQYRADGWTVFATHRDEAGAAKLKALGASGIRVDVLDPDDLTRLGGELGTARLEVALVNAGVYGPRTTSLRQPPAADEFDAVMRTNVRAAMLVAPILADRLARPGGTLAFLSSRMGSIAQTTAFNGALYRVSKAAQNMVARLAHNEFGAKGVRVLSFHPGWVRTDMGGAGASVAVEDSVAGLRKVLADPVQYPGGGFYDYLGASIDW